MIDKWEDEGISAMDAIRRLSKDQKEKESLHQKKVRATEEIIEGIIQRLIGDAPGVRLLVHAPMRYMKETITRKTLLRDKRKIQMLLRDMIHKDRRAQSTISFDFTSGRKFSKSQANDVFDITKTKQMLPQHENNIAKDFRWEAVEEAIGRQISCEQRASMKRQAELIEKACKAMHEDYDKYVKGEV